MKWWVRKNGHTEGPFSENDIKKRIAFNLLGSLDRVSSDGSRWKYLKDTELWRPGGTKVETNPSLGEKIEAGPMPRRLEVPRQGIPNRRKNRVLIWGLFGGLALLLGVLICVGILVVRNLKSQDQAVAESGFTAVKDKIALIESPEGSGTGFLLGMDGKTYLVSNEHVVRSGNEIKARLIDGTDLQLGEFSVASDGRDLARFEVLNCKNAPLVLRTSIPSIGEQVAVYGNSLGEGVATESKGFVQGVGPKRIETNAEIVNGNSGSPLIDTKGEVIGVAAYMKLTDSGQENWGNANTRYDGKVRRFAVRLSDVDWKTLKRSEYEAQVRALDLFKLYCVHLSPFLLFDSCKIDDAKLVYNDLDSKGFRSDEAGFDEMLKAVAKAYGKMGKSCVRWVEHDKERQGFIQRLNAAIAAKEISKAAAEKKLVEFDNNNKTGLAYEKMKEALRAMILVRKEALNHALAFLDGRTWSTPQLANGYEDDIRGSIADYRKGCKAAMELMNQKLKDLNKGIKEFEKGDDDDEND